MSEARGARLTVRPTNVVWSAAGVAAITFVAFSRTLLNGFVNWDDPAVLIDNVHLRSPGLLSWAFTTTLIGHYQPLGWLVWGTARAVFGPAPLTFHVLSVVGHAVNAALVYLVTLQLLRTFGGEPAAGVSRRANAAAVVAAVAFGAHPVRVEAVAWASALPYVLSLAALLVSFSTYLSGRRFASVGCYAASLLSRAVAIGFPLVLLIVDLYPVNRTRRSTIGRLVIEKIPFAALAVIAIVVEGHSREVATLQEVGLGARLSMAVTAPFVYLGRTFWPIHLSPLDPLPISPMFGITSFILGTCGLMIVTVATWMVRRRSPAALAFWFSFAALLAPVIGLVPSGVQATADRYLYVPGVVVSMAVGVVAARCARSWSARSWGTMASNLGVAVAVTLTIALTVISWQQVGYWHDSIALWTRTADLDPSDDIATYNLAIALAEAGREDEAIARYEQTLRLVPDHELARQNLAIIQAARAERDGDRFARAGNLVAAREAYARALSLDSKRLHARAARGVIEAQGGQLSDAVDDLTKAFDGHVKDPAVPNALAFALIQTGHPDQAVNVLERALDEHPGDAGIAHNLELAREVAAHAGKDGRPTAK